MKERLLYTRILCEVQMALIAINAKSSICLRWHFPGWQLSCVAFVRVTVVVGGAVIEGGQPQDHTEFGVGSGIRDQGSGSEGGVFHPPSPDLYFQYFFVFLIFFIFFALWYFFIFTLTFSILNFIF